MVGHTVITMLQNIFVSLPPLFGWHVKYIKLMTDIHSFRKQQTLVSVQGCEALECLYPTSTFPFQNVHHSMSSFNVPVQEIGPNLKSLIVLEMPWISPNIPLQTRGRDSKTLPQYKLSHCSSSEEHSVQLSQWVVTDSLWPYALPHTRPPCPSEKHKTVKK